MRDFKVGDKVIRRAGVARDVEIRTGIRRGCVYTVATARSGCITLMESLDLPFTFAEDAFNLVSADAPWDRDEALRLRKEAEAAITRYNDYIAKQPRLEPITIK
ncbi:unknown function [Klebsiella phage vB_Kpl_K72PH164C2]|uniref:Uncharacterized protein n=1 Tax=Klebsiella phage vB_Kpl_K72PH164C2 TaxID=3071646 RepID=A0AAD2GSF1_9CAUD|nr:unknown function [Klebsiella phage vB_Kpl_K72PH164C2]